MAWESSEHTIVSISIAGIGSGPFNLALDSTFLMARNRFSWFVLACFAVAFPAGTAAAQGWLGVRLADAERPTIAEVIPGSPAEKAGLEAGDVFVEVDGDEVESIDGLIRAVQQREAGSKVSLELRRDGETVEIEVVLGTNPETAAEARPDRPRTQPRESREPPRPTAESTEPDRPLLGIEIEESDDGLRVTAVESGAPAARAGIAVGDVLRRFAGSRVRDIDDVDRIVPRLRAGQTIEIEVVRGDERVELEVKLGGRAAETRPERPARPERLAPVRRPAAADEARAFGTSFSAAQRAARSSGKPLLIVFGAEWSANSKALRKSFDAEVVKRQLGKFERVWVDADKNDGLVDEFDVDDLPKIVIRRRGRTVATVDGYAPPDELAEILGDAAGDGREAAPERTRRDAERAAEARARTDAAEAREREHDAESHERGDESRERREADELQREIDDLKKQLADLKAMLRELLKHKDR